MKSNEMIKDRYTTKIYNKNYKLSSAIKENIKNILQHSPSSINSQPWRFYFVSNEEIKNKLAEVSFFNKEKVQNCSLLIVFSSLTLLEFTKQHEEHGSEPGKLYFNENIKNKKKEDIESWIKNQVYLSLGFLLASLGFEKVDSTSLEGIDQKKYENILNIDGNKEKVLFAVAIGQRDGDDENQPKFKGKVRLDEDIIIKEI